MLRNGPSSIIRSVVVEKKVASVHTISIIRPRDNFVVRRWRRRRPPLGEKTGIFDRSCCMTVSIALATGMVSVIKGMTRIVVVVAPTDFTIDIVVTIHLRNTDFALFTKTPVGPKPHRRKLRYVFATVITVVVDIYRFTRNVRRVTVTDVTAVTFVVSLLRLLTRPIAPTNLTT